MDSKKVGVLAGIVSIAAYLVQVGSSLLTARWFDSGVGEILPTVGTAGETMMTYAYLLGIVEGIAIVGLALGLGYYVSQHIDITTDFKRFVIATGLGSALAVILIGLLFDLVGFAGTSLTGSTVILTVGIFIRMIVEIALPITIGAVAGSAITHFWRGGTDPPQPSATAGPSPDDPPSQPSIHDNEIDSRSHT